LTAQWALDYVERGDDLPLQRIAAEVTARFAPGSTSVLDVPRLREFVDALATGTPMHALEGSVRALSHAGYLRAALVAMAFALERNPRSDVALALGRELLDAIEPDIGIRLIRAVLALPEVDTQRYAPASVFVTANRMLGDAMFDRDDPQAALRHFEAVLSVDVDDARALRGWAKATRVLERRGVNVEHRSRGLSLIDGIDELELSAGFGVERYELGRPLGRGRHAVVYQAFDRHVGRDVAIKRLLDVEGKPTGARVFDSRFFAEARTLARVRSPHVVALYDVQPKPRFIALELCRGGNLRLALRRGLVGPEDLDRIGRQLGAALTAVHAADAVHRDIKPANILVRLPRRGSSVALADFGLAIAPSPNATGTRAGTLRYLAPELRRGSGRATPASDRFSIGVVLLELARAPAPLPSAFDELEGVHDASPLVPEGIPEDWKARILRLLSPVPEERAW